MLVYMGAKLQHPASTVTKPSMGRVLPTQLDLIFFKFVAIEDLFEDIFAVRWHYLKYQQGLMSYC